MGTIDNSAHNNQAEIIYLRPQEIEILEHYNVRPYTSSEQGASEREARRIEKMADSMEEVGQIETGIVVPSSTPGKFSLYSGNRRRKAITLVNDRRSRRGEPLMLMRVMVDRSGGDIKRKAAHSNFQRTDSNPMDMALLMQQTLEEQGWEDNISGHKKLAKYFSCAYPTIFNYLKFLKTDKDIQRRLSEGQLSADTATRLLSNVKPEKLTEVLADAEIKQMEADAAQASKTEAQIKRHGTKEERAALKEAKAKAETEQPDPKPPAAPAKPKRIKPAVLQKAIDDIEGAKVVVTQKTRPQIIEFFETIGDSPAYGPEDSLVREFCRYLSGKWASGNGTNKTLLAKFDEMVDLKNIDKKKNEKIAAQAQKAKAKRAKAEAAKPDTKKSAPHAHRSAKSKRQTSGRKSSKAAGELSATA